MRVVSNTSTDLLRIREGQRSVLASLIEHCPTLRNVTLNGEIHALHSSGKWMNVEDIVEIFEKQQREAVTKGDAGSPSGTSQSNFDGVDARPAAKQDG